MLNTKLYMLCRDASLIAYACCRNVILVNVGSAVSGFAFFSFVAGS